MRVGAWKGKEILKNITGQALDNLSNAMDDVVIIAKQKAPTGKKARKATPGSKVWTERVPGALKRSIRRVARTDKQNVRVYAGNFNVYYARFVEVGTVKMRARPFLRPAFQQVKGGILKRIKDGN